MKKRIVIGGSLAQRPGRGGHTWVFLQYLLGFRRLGWDVLFLDRLEPDMLVDRLGRKADLDRSCNLAYTHHVLESFGLGEHYGIALDGGRRWVGRTRDEVVDFVRTSDALINVMGFIDDPEVLAAAPLRVFLDIDPGFGQIWNELGLADPFAGHDRHVTIGERVGEDGCMVPTCGLDWIPTPQPIVLEEWPETPSTSDVFSTVATWRGEMAPLQYAGRQLGLRVHEFRRFIELPRRTGRDFTLALDIHADESADLERLRAGGWTLEDPMAVACDPWRYRRFVQGSGAEIMIAKNLYVETRAGWFSDRSIGYLASGRPVLAQDTGLPDALSGGVGLVPFSTLDEAVAGTESILREPARHARAARELAETYFDSDRVLPRLMDAVWSAPRLPAREMTAVGGAP